MSSHTLAWRGVEPTRVEGAVVRLGDDRLDARGTSLTGEYALDWRLSTGAEFVTRRLSVRLRDDGGARALELGRSEAGVWTAVRREGGGEEPLDTSGLDGAALDCDLALCPFTNTIPIVRHGLVGGDGRTAELVMAWVSVPDLSLHASPQAYTAVAVDDDHTARVAFAGEGFAATLVVDGDGFVVDYPGIASRLG
ncbi:MAG TPA: putative glycolipid-binding domain-containing protein [Acidimicrobiales bacterium]|nr:putative glycolipid-binding domain-containing protein [Acidimicrobiales bacterium]